MVNHINMSQVEAQEIMLDVLTGSPVCYYCLYAPPDTPIQRREVRTLNAHLARNTSCNEVETHSQHH